MTLEKDVEEKQKKLEEYFQRRIEIMREIKYKMGAIAETSIDFDSKKDAKMMEFVSLCFEELFMWHKTTFDGFAKISKVVIAMRDWVRYLNEIIPSMKPVLKRENREKIEELEKRLKVMEGFKPTLKDLQEAFEKAKEQAEEATKKLEGLYV